MKIILRIMMLTLLFPLLGNACSMYKVTANGKTIVGNNEDWFSPNSQFWYEQGEGDAFGVMYMGLMDNFAQGALNEAGLVFDGFANPELEIKNTVGKKEIRIGDAIKHIMQTMRTTEEVQTYLATINLSSLSSSQIVFVDKSGTYLIVEGDELILGEEAEKGFSNFYYSQIESLEEVKLDNFQSGLRFLNASEGQSSMTYCSEAMESFSNSKVFGTQYSTIYDLSTLTVRVYLFHDYSEFVEIDLRKELGKANHSMMIADLFPKNSIGYQHYQKYNDTERPTVFLKDLVSTAPNLSEAELVAMDFNTIINMVGYEWLKERANPPAAIKVFEYGVTLLPNDANLYDSLGEAYAKNEDWMPAIKNYGKSLSLNPENDNALQMLAEIRKEMKGDADTE